MRSNLVDLFVQMHAETEKAVLISDTGEEAAAVWLPKSQIEVEYDPTMKVRGKGAATITCPEWLAKDKGLI